MKQVFGKVCRASVAAAGVLVAASTASAESRPVSLETEFDLDLVGASLAAAPQAGALAFDLPSAAAKWEESIGSYLEGLLKAETAPAAEAPQANDAVTAAVVGTEIKAFAQPQAAEAKPETKPEAKADSQRLPGRVKVAMGYDLGDAVLEIEAAVLARAEGKATKPAPEPQVAVALSPQLLAPVLSQPMGCESCATHRAAQVRADEEAAWQKLSTWFAARVAEDAAANARAAEARVDDAAALAGLADWASGRVAEDRDAADNGEAASADGDMLFDFFSGEDEPTE